MAIEQIPSRRCDTWVDVQPLSVVSDDLCQRGWVHWAFDMFMIETTIIARQMHKNDQRSSNENSLH